MKCEAEYLITKMNFPRYKKCRYEAKVVRDGKHFCRLHDPQRLAERKEKIDIQKEQHREKNFKMHITYLYLKQRTTNNG